MTPAVLFQVSRSWLWPPRFVCLSRLWMLVCLVTSFLLWIQKSCWCFICPAFSYYRDRSDNIQAVSMLELNLEVFHARIFTCIIIFNFLNKPVEYRHTWFYCFTLLCFADTEFFTNWRFVATLQVCWHHFSNNICSLHISVSHFGNSHNVSSFFIVIFVVVTCDQWSLLLQLQKDYNS